MRIVFKNAFFWRVSLREFTRRAENCDVVVALRHEAGENRKQVVFLQFVWHLIAVTAKPLHQDKQQPRRAI